MEKISLKNIKLVKGNDVLLTNINIDLFKGENVVFKASNHQDFKSINSLFKIIANIIQPSSGVVSFENFSNQRILVGYHNLEHIFKREIILSDLLKTLVRTQKINDDNLSEIQEILEMFKLNQSALINQLEFKDKQLLNLLTLLIIKPQFIFIDHLQLPGSKMMQNTILEYLKQYCDRYDITLILASDENESIMAIANRIISLSQAKIVNDISLNKISNETINQVDNRTKAYDLEDDIINALSNNNHNSSIDNELSSIPTHHQNQVEKPIKKEVEYYHQVSNHSNGDEDLIRQVTKALADDYEEDIIISMKNTDDINHLLKNDNQFENSVTNDLLTLKYETSLDNDTTFNDNQKLYQQETDDNQEQVNYHQTSLNKKFNDSIEFKNEEIIQKTREFNEESKDTLQDIKFAQYKEANDKKNINTIAHHFHNHEKNTNNLLDAYMTREFLSEIKETYAMRKALSEQIKSADFSKLTPDLQHKVFQNHDAADKLIKEIDPEGKYDPDKLTSSYTTKKIINDNNRNQTVTSAMFAEDNDFDIHETKYQPHETKHQSAKFNYDASSTESTTNFNQNSSNFNHHHKKHSWKNKFMKKEHHSNQDRYVTKNFEPTTNFNKNFKTNVIKPENKNYKTKYFNNENPAEPKCLKTMAIKQRSKRNSIEKLFDEAIQDKKIIDEYNEKKVK